MACKYWYDGSFRTEAEFKSILENGLIDQLVNDQVVSLKEFELDSSKIKNEAKTSITKKPIELRIRRKIQRNLNVGKTRGTKKDPLKNNPATLLQQAADARGDKDNKLMLVIKTTSGVNMGLNTEGDTQLESIHTGEGKLAKEIKEIIKNSKVDYTASMKPGYVYMLVPSAYGYYPVRLFTNLVKDTTDFDIVKKELKNLKEATDPSDIQAARTALEDILYRFEVKYDRQNEEFVLNWTEILEGGGIKENTVKVPGNDISAAEEFLGSRIRKVAYYEINSDGYNEKLANNNAIKTDLFHDNGNFFHSSSFFLETYQLSSEEKESYKEQVLEFDKSNTPIFNEEFAESAESTSTPNPDVSSTKEQESPLFNEEFLDDADLEGLGISMDQLLGSARATQAEEKKGTAEETTEESDTEDIFKEGSLEDIENAIEAAKEQEAEELNKGAEVVEESISKTLKALEEESAKQQSLVDTNEETGDDIDTDGLNDDDGDFFADPNLKTKMGPKADLPSKEDAKKAREKGLETLKRILGESFKRESGKGGTVRIVRNFENIKNYLPKESFEQLEEALKHGDELYGLFTTAAVLIQELAPAGTEAHEAFHVIFNLVLPLEQRFKILNEVFYKYQEEIPLTRKEVTLKDGTKKVQYVRPTFIELEEFLADKFMSYEQTQEVDKLKPLDKKSFEKKKSGLTGVPTYDAYNAGVANFKNANSFFKGLSRMLKVFFKKNKALNIDNLFENINLGVYSDSIEFKNTVLKRSVRQSIGQSQRTTAPNRKYVNPVEQKWALRFFNSKIKRALQGFREQIDPEGKLSVPELINKLKIKADPKNNVKGGSGPHVLFTNAITSVVRDIGKLKNLKAQAEAKGDRKAVAKYNSLLHSYSKFYKIITNNQKAVRKNNRQQIEFLESTDLLEKFTRFLKTNEGVEISYGGYNAEAAVRQEDSTGQITGEEAIKQIEEGETTSDMVAQTNSIERNPKQGLRQQLISFFANVPKYTSKGTPAVTPFGIQDVEDSQVVFAALISKVSNSYTLEEFNEKLTKIDKPWKKDIIELFNNNPRLRTLFWTNFASKNYAEFVSVYEVNGEFRVFNSNAKGIKDIISQDLIANFLSTNNPLFRTDKAASNWTDNIIAAKAKEFFDSAIIAKNVYDRLPASNNEEVQKKSQEIFEKTLLKEISKIISQVNIPISPEQIIKIYESGGKDFKYKRAKIGALLGVLIKIGQQLTGAEAYAIERREVVENGKRVVKNIPKYVRDATKRKNPFTSLMPETDIEFSKDKQSGKSLVEQLAQIIEPALDSELVSSFRGVGGKSKYNIILSGQINKMLSKFNNEAELDAFIESIADDKLLSSLPLLKDLQGDEALRNTFKSVILDGLTRKGQNKAISYNRMSDIEMEATSIGLFYGRSAAYKDRKNIMVKLGIASDSPTAHYIKAKRLTKEEIIDKLTETAIGELERIKYIKKLKKDNPTHALLQAENYSENALKFQLLTFLNKVPGKNLKTKEGIKKEIENFFKFDLKKDGFFKQQVEKYTEVGIINSIAEDTELINFTEGILDTKLKDNAEQNEVFIDYLLNTFYYQMQTNVLFAGDPSFYKGTTDYQKRFKQIFSPGTYTTGTGTFDAVILEDSMVPTSQENLKHIYDIIDESDMTAIEKKALKIMWKEKADAKKKKNQNNESDGGTFVSLDFRKKVLEDLGEWGEAHDKAYERIKNGNETIEDLRIIDPPASPLKPFMFTKINVGGTQVPIQVKNSETVLTKSFALKKDKKGNLVYPKLAAVYNDMQDQKYEVAFFQSAIKVGGIKNISDNRFTHYESTNEGYQPSVGYDGMKVFRLDRSDYRKQQETPAHHIDERSNFGSQLRTLIISDINLEGNYSLNIGGKDTLISGQKIVQMYQDTIFDDLKESFESVEKEMVNSDGSLNYNKLIPLLREHALERNMGDQYLQAIAPVEVTINDEILGGTKKVITTALPLFHPRILFQTESLLHSIFRNRVVKQKIKGGGLINTPSYGVSTLTEEDALGLVDEKFHPKLKIKDGKIIWQVLMPHTSKKFFPKNKKGEVDFEYIKMYAPELLEIIANRIPTEDKYSMFNIEVIGFTPPSMANTIIMPPEVTTIAGLDFDIDKLYFLSKQFKIIDNVPKIVKYYDSIENIDQARDLAENIFRSDILLDRLVEQTKSPLITKEPFFISKVEDVVRELALATKNKNASIQEIKALIREAKEDLKKSKELGTQDAKDLREQSKENIKAYRDILNEEEYDEDLAEKSEALEEALAKKKEVIDVIAKALMRKELEITQFNSRAARDNNKVNILKSILENRNTAPAIINPGNFDILKEMGARIRLLKAGKIKEAKLTGEKLRDAADKLDEDRDFNIAYPSTQLELFRRNMDGSDLIGIMANHNTHHAKAQYTNLRLKDDLQFNGEIYNSLHNTKSKSDKRISRSLATKLAAVVDNAKEPISAFLNFNTFTANIVALGDRLGVDEQFIFALINQPAILELTQRIKNEQGSIGRTKLLGIIKKEIITDLEQNIDKNSTFKQPIIKELTTELLENNLQKSDTAKSAAIQKTALALFEQLFEIGEELSRGVQAAKTDAITAYGSTSARDWEFLNAQRRVIKDQEADRSKILGLDEIILPKNSRQRMNPAFTLYGLYKPITVYEKVFPTIGNLDETDPTNIVFSNLGLIKERFTDFKSSGTLTAEESQMVNSNYLNYIASEFKFFNHSQSKDILNNLPAQLLKFKRNLPEDSSFKPLMDQLHIVRPDRRSPITRIEFYQTGKDSADIEALSASWERMLLDSDPKNVEMAKNLIKYTFFSNGFNFGPNTFANVVPVMFFTNEYQSTQDDLKIQDGGGQLTLNELLQKRLFSKNYDGEYNGRFMDQFIRNFSGRHSFIPTAKIDITLSDSIDPNETSKSTHIIEDKSGNLLIRDSKATKYLRNLDDKPIEYVRVFNTKKNNHYSNNIYKLVDSITITDNYQNQILLYKYVKVPNLGINNVALDFNALNDIKESVKPSPEDIKKTTEAKRLADLAVSKEVADNIKNDSKVPPVVPPVGEAPASSNNTYRELRIIEAEDIINAEGEKGAAQYDAKNKIIKINKTLLEQKFKEKAWTNMRKLIEIIDGEKITSQAANMPENQFTTYEDFEKFVIEHEYQHSIYTREDFNKEFPNENKGAYETVINNRAIMVSPMITKQAITEESTVLQDTTQLYTVEFKNKKYLAEINKGEFKVYSQNNKRLWENKTINNDPVLKQLFDQLIAQVGKNKYPYEGTVTSGGRIISKLYKESEWNALSLAEQQNILKCN